MITEDRAGPGAGETWRHYKGGLYQIDAIGKMEATQELVVIYYSKANPLGVRWVRPLAEFMEDVDHDRGLGAMHRFKRVS